MTREQRAEKIIAYPDRYKICESCESILKAKTILCQHCHSYRFETEPERVKAHAKDLVEPEVRRIFEDD